MKHPESDPTPFTALSPEEAVNLTREFPERLFHIFARAMPPSEHITVQAVPNGRSFASALIAIGDEARAAGIRLGLCRVCILPKGMTREQAERTIESALADNGMRGFSSVNEALTPPVDPELN